MIFAACTRSEAFLFFTVLSILLIKSIIGDFTRVNWPNFRSLSLCLYLSVLKAESTIIFCALMEALSFDKISADVWR